MPKTKVKAANVKVPQNKEEANDFIAKIGELDRNRAKLKAAMNDSIEAIKKDYDTQARPLASEIDDLSEGVKMWSEANRGDLTNGGRVKSVMLGAGEISWRNLPAKVGIRGKDKVIEACKNLGLMKFLRTKIEINKEAMLADPNVASEIKGVTIGSEGEQFTITPNETELEEVL